MPDNTARTAQFIFTQMCPHCSQQIMVASRFQTPVIDWVLKPEDLANAKKELIEEIRKTDKIKDEDERQRILAYYEKPDTLMGPDAVVPLLQQLTSNTDASPEEPKA